MSDPKENTAETVERLSRESANIPSILELPNGRTYAVMPKNFELRDITENQLLDPPLAKWCDEYIEIHTPSSLIDYVNTYKNNNTVIFADQRTSNIKAIIDYHGASENTDGRVSPALCAHVADFKLIVSNEWTTWSSESGELMKQLDFARFIEENRDDIIKPSAASIYELVRDITGARRVTFGRAVRSDSGNEKIEYSDQTNISSRGSLEIPREFELKIPVFYGSSCFNVTAFMRYSLGDDNSLSIGYNLKNAVSTRLNAFQEIVYTIQNGTGCPCYFGFRD